MNIIHRKPRKESSVYNSCCIFALFYLFFILYSSVQKLIVCETNVRLASIAFPKTRVINFFLGKSSLYFIFLLYCSYLLFLFQIICFAFRIWAYVERFEKYRLSRIHCCCVNAQTHQTLLGTVLALAFEERNVLKFSWCENAAKLASTSLHLILQLLESCMFRQRLLYSAVVIIGLQWVTVF